MIRRALQSASESERLKDTAVTMPVTRGLVDRFVAGEVAEEAVAKAQELTDRGLTVTIDRLGEAIDDRAGAEVARDDYLVLLDLLQAAGLHADAEVSVKLSALGQALQDEGHAIALDNARAICAKAQAIGTTVTVDMEDHTTTDATLAAVRALREDYPWVGAVLQAYLFPRTEQDLQGPRPRGVTGPAVQGGLPRTVLPSPTRSATRSTFRTCAA